MSRFLEAVFVFGCSLVGFGMNVGGSQPVQSAVVRLVNFNVRLPRLGPFVEHALRCRATGSAREGNQ